MTYDQDSAFNVWDDPWITVVDHAGIQQDVSVVTAFLDAHRFRALADPVPLVVGGTQRFLAAILQFIFHPKSPHELYRLLATGSFPREQIEAFGDHFRDRFAVFHPETPFFQSGDIPLSAEVWMQQKQAKIPVTVGYLYVDIPTASNRAFVHHVRDEDHAVCPACCVQGLVCFPAFAQAGGSGWRPSINGNPPLYLMPHAHSLFLSLGLSLITPEYQPKVAAPDREHVAPWTDSATVLAQEKRIAVGYIEGLTFPARRVRLFPALSPGHCTRCSKLSSIRVSEMVWEYGAYRPNEAEWWKDPFIAYKPGKESPRAMGLHHGKALWREYATLFLQEEEAFAPSVVKQCAEVSEYGMDGIHDLEFRCIGIKTDKAKVSEWIDEGFTVPPALLTNEARLAVIREALTRVNEVAGAMHRGFSTLQHELSDARRTKTRALATLRSRMEDSFWATRLSPFLRLIQDVSHETDFTALQHAWARECLQDGERIFRTTIEHIGGHKQLYEAQAKAFGTYMKWFMTYRKEWGLDVKETSRDGVE